MAKEFDEWKQGVSRATSYVQSNASIQVQVFGFYISALGLAIAIARDDVRPLVFYGFIPLSAIVLLSINASYFRFIAYQDMWLYLYGRSYNENSRYKSHEEFFDKLEDVSLSKACRYMLLYWEAMPYFAIWWAYLAAPPLLAMAYSLSTRPGDVAVVVLGCIVYIAASVFVFSLLSRRGWAAIEHWEAKVSGGAQNHREIL